MNICIISREFPPDTAFGGIATFSFDTAKLLKSHGHNVTVLSQSLTETNTIFIEGICVYKIKIPSPFDSYARLPVFIIFFNLYIYFYVMRLHRKNQFDIIDVPDHLAEGLFTIFFRKIPVVTRLHTPYSLLVDMGLNNYKKGLSYWFIRKFEKAALKRSNALYAPSMDLVRRCNRMFNIEKIPLLIYGYPIDLNLFKPSNDFSVNNFRRILFLGRLEQRKGIETLAEAFPKIISNYPDATLTIVGSDTPNILGYESGRVYLEKMYIKSNCLDSVTFISNLPLKKLPEVFHNHDIIWIPSLYDNYPLICLEAMSCGKSVIASNVGGLPEIVNDGKNGFIFECENTDDLVNKTIKIFMNTEIGINFGKNARKFCEHNYSENYIYEKNIQLYEMAKHNLGAIN